MNVSKPASLIANGSDTIKSAGGNSQQTRAQRFNEARNAVQAQIEKMFQDASAANGNISNKAGQLQQQQQQPQQQQQQHHHIEPNGPVTIINVRSPPEPVVQPSVIKVHHSKQNVPLPPIPDSCSPVPPAVKPPAPEPSANTNQYKVDYLGSLSLPGRATSLESLQYPLKELYSRYRADNLNSKSVYRGTMEISPAGLRILYYSSEGKRPFVSPPFPQHSHQPSLRTFPMSQYPLRHFAFIVFTSKVEIL